MNLLWKFPTEPHSIRSSFLSVACPPSIFTLIRSNSLTSPYKQSNYDPNMGLFIIFIIVLCLFKSLVIKSIPMPKQKCIGLNQNEGALISLFEKEPLLCLQKWCYYNGFRSKHCSINIYGKDNTCKACISSYKNFSRDLMYIKGKSCPVLKKIFRKCLFTWISGARWMSIALNKGRCRTWDDKALHFDHLLHYCELPVKRAIPLALSLMYIYCKNFVQSYHLCQFCLYSSLNFSIFDHCHFQTVFHTNVNYCHPFFYSSMKLPFISLIWTFHIVNHFIHYHWCWPNHSHSVSIQWCHISISSGGSCSIRHYESWSVV